MNRRARRGAEVRAVAGRQLDDRHARQALIAGSRPCPGCAAEQASGVTAGQDAHTCPVGSAMFTVPAGIPLGPTPVLVGQVVAATAYMVTAGEFADYRVLMVCGDQGDAEWQADTWNRENSPAADMRARVEPVPFIPAGGTR